MSMYLAAFTWLQQSGARFAFDEFAEKVWVEAPALNPTRRLLDDRCINELRHEMVVSSNAVDPGPQNIYQAALKLGYLNSYNEVRDYFDALEHDGTPWLGKRLLEAMGVDNTPLNRNTIKRQIVAGVARVYEPGAPANLMMILAGEQRIGKSPFCRILARKPHLFTDTSPLRLDAQRRQELLRDKHIVEISEMQGWRNSSTESLKAFNSATHDYGRRVWGTHSIDQARKCIFIGTTNDIRPLRDTTGNGRFPFLHCRRRIDLELIEENIDQIWAHACVLYWAGFSLDLPNHLSETLAETQRAHMEDDPWVEALATLPPSSIMNGEERATYAGVFARLGMQVGHASQADTRRASDAMVRNGWSLPKPCKIDGKTVRCFTREERKKKGS